LAVDLGSLLDRNHSYSCHRKVRTAQLRNPHWKSRKEAGAKCNANSAARVVFGAFTHPPDVRLGSYRTKAHSSPAFAIRAFRRPSLGLDDGDMYRNRPV